MIPTGICPICLQRKRLTKHHIFPRFRFGRSRRNNEIVRLCFECHQILHQIIQDEENKILKTFPEIYAGTLNRLIAEDPEFVEKYNNKKRKKN